MHRWFTLFLVLLVGSAQHASPFVSTHASPDDRNLPGHIHEAGEHVTPDTGASPLDCVCTCRHDGSGSVRYLTDDTSGSATYGQVTDTYLYDSYGIQIGGSGSTVNSYRYTGEQWDSDLEMYYLRARYYRPELGRFLDKGYVGRQPAGPAFVASVPLLPSGSSELG